MKFAICNELFEGWSWERVCDFVGPLGYTGLEVAPFTLADDAREVSPDQRRSLRAAADARGVEVLGLHWLLVKPAGLYITSPDAGVRRRTADYFRLLAHLCADLGGKVMVVGSPKQRSLLPGVSLQQANEFTVEVFRHALPDAEARGVTFAFEPLAPSQTNYINTVEQAMELVKTLDHPNFQLNLDVIAMSSQTQSISDVIRSARGHIAHVQVNDPNMLGPGMGDTRFEPIIAALREVGYDGWLSVEAFDFRPGPEKIARDSIDYLMKVK